MKSRKIDICWDLSLLIIGIITIILSVSRIAGITLPDYAIRICGFIDIVSLVVLSYTSVKRLSRKK